MGKVILTIIMKIVVIVGFVLLSGCFWVGQEQYEDVLTKPSDQWSSREALTVIISPIGNNFFDGQTNIKVMATPYYPSVILALQRKAQQRHHWSEDEFRSNTDSLMREALGMSVDWRNNRFYDSRGYYFWDKYQIDSLMFLITIDNTAWPCNSMMAVSLNGVPSPVMVPLVPPDQCYTPDISELEQHIYLINSKGNFIKPTYVWGKRHNMLTVEETMFAMFQVREGSYHFFKGSDKVSLVVKGFEKDIVLDFSLSRVR